MTHTHLSISLLGFKFDASVTAPNLVYSIASHTRRIYPGSIYLIAGGQLHKLFLMLEKVLTKVVIF